MIPNRANNADNWTLAELTLILLRQFKRLLVEKEIELTDAEMKAIAEQVQARAVDDTRRLTTALAELVAESVAQLAEWNLTFAASLATEMTDLDHLWQSTADFLDLANRKGNAEIRISAGSTLMALLGDDQNTAYLCQAVTHDLRVHGTLDVDAVIAKRGLLYIAGIDPSAEDWPNQIRVWCD
jgi:hypothetical protein